MTTLKPIALFMIVCTLLMAACSADSPSDPTPADTNTPLPFPTSAIRERMTLPPSWTPTATPSITPTPTNTLTPTITQTPSITPTRTANEVCQNFSGDFMAYGQVRYEPDDWIGYFFSYDDPNGEIILVAEKQNSDEVVEIKLPAGFLMGTFDMDVLTAGTWQLRYSLKTSIYTRLCESDPITIEVVQPSQLDRLIDALSTVSAARNVTPTPTFTPEPEPTSEATP